MWTAISAVLTAVIAALASYFGNQRADAAKIDAAKDEAVKDAATETQDIVKEAADARSALRPASSASGLIAELRARAESRRSEGGS